MLKKSFLTLITICIIIAGAIIFYFMRDNSGNLSVSSSPTPDSTHSTGSGQVGSPQASPSPTPSASSGPSGPRPTPSGTPGLWEQLSGEASCELKGEIKYVSMDPRIYDNQDVLFSYKGVDHPARLINWVVSPNDGLSIGPNLFAHLPLPDGENLIGISLPENPKYKTYELTASITYGRLIDGNIQVFTKQCAGKTTVVLP